MMVPFCADQQSSVIRATLSAGMIDHRLPPVYHDNPLSEKGSLVFTDFGWDILGFMANAGFTEARAEIYANPELGHIGGPQIVFWAST